MNFFKLLKNIEGNKFEMNLIGLFMLLFFNFYKLIRLNSFHFIKSFLQILFF